MGFQLDVAYVDIVLREHQANRQLETFRQTTVRKSQQTARESSGAFETILFGKMGASVEGMQNTFARSFGHIGKIFLRTGLLGIGIMEGTHLLIGFAQEMFSGGEAAEKMAAKVKELHGEMKLLGLESARTSDAIGELFRKQEALMRGKLPAETPEEKVANKFLNSELRDHVKELFKGYEKEEDEVRKNLDKLGIGKDKTAQQTAQAKEADYQAQEADIVARMDKYEARLRMLPARAEANDSPGVKEAYFEGGTREGQRRKLSEQIVDQQISSLTTDIKEIQNKKESLGKFVGGLSDVTEADRKAQKAEPHLYSSAEQFGNKILEMGGSREDSQDRNTRATEELTKKIDEFNRNLKMGDAGGGMHAVAKGGGGVQH